MEDLSLPPKDTPQNAPIIYNDVHCWRVYTRGKAAAHWSTRNQGLNGGHTLYYREKLWFWDCMYLTDKQIIRTVRVRVTHTHTYTHTRTHTSHLSHSLIEIIKELVTSYY
jgi:hypothetical protein